MKVSKNKRGQWFYDFTFGDRRYRVLTGLNKADTESAMHEKIERLKKAKHGIFENAPVQELVKFEDFAKDFIELYSKVERRPNTTASHKNSIDKHLVPFFKGRSLQDLTPELVERYKAERRAKVSPATVNRELACLGAICRKAVKWRKIKANPTADVAKFAEPRGKDRILTSEETGRLLSCAGGVLRPFLIIALNTGMRRNEILSLKWQNIDLVKKLFSIEAENSKSRKPRAVPMNDLVIATLKSMPKESEYVFFNPETNRNIQGIKTSFKTACRNSKINTLRLHDLRHTAASRMIEAGVDIVTVSKILGHSKIEMTMRYCHPTSESMQRAVDKLGATFANQVESGKNPVIDRAQAEVALPVTHSFVSH